jgi:hypothetical protein
VGPAAPPASQPASAPAQPPVIQTQRQPLAGPPENAEAELQAYAPNEDDVDRPSGAPSPSSPVFAAGPDSTAPATPPPANAPGNISSAELEDMEVQKTAAELKKEMAEKADNAATEAARQDGHVADVENGNNDTIFIDHDGAFTPAAKTDQQP